MLRGLLIWGLFASVVLVPLALSATSPLLAWREPIYIAAGFAGIIAFGVMPLQPLGIAGWLPGLSTLGTRKLHRWLGGAIFATVVIHVAGLWITSPPDVIDALLFRSATSFSIWGVLAMWAILASGGLAMLRLRGRMRWRTWRVIHPALGVLALLGTIIHVILIDGTMETVSKFMLCGFAFLAVAVLVIAPRRN